MAPKRQFIAIDLKSFYASVEAAERGYDPLDVNLVVADESRTDKTICLAVEGGKVLFIEDINKIECDAFDELMW